MVKFLKPNKAVIVLQGRFAGRKAVIIREFDEGCRDRPYGLVIGIYKYSKKVMIRKDSDKKTAKKKSRVKAFIKLVNLPTRYTLDVDLKDVVTLDALQAPLEESSFRSGACLVVRINQGDEPQNNDLLS